VLFKGISQILVRRTWFLDGFFVDKCGENVVLERHFFAAENFPRFEIYFLPDVRDGRFAATPGGQLIYPAP
jgi:hypothetical protein